MAEGAIGVPNSSRADEPLLKLRAGWPAASIGLVLAVLTAATITASSDSSIWFVQRLAIAGVVMFTGAVVFGSERMVGLAALPMLTAALLGADHGLGLPWGRALIVGCLWYGALEAGWSSIEHRHGAVVSAAVAKRRVQEVATIVVLAVLVGAGGMALSALAPTRTLVVRTAVVVAVLVALTMALRQLRSTGPATDPDLLDRQAGGLRR